MDKYRETIAALLRAQLTPLEYLVLTAVYLDGLSEAVAASQLTIDLGVPVSRSMVHRAKQDALARVRLEVAA